MFLDDKDNHVVFNRGLLFVCAWWKMLKYEKCMKDTVSVSDM
jgi:hypothetical protein